MRLPDFVRFGVDRAFKGSLAAAVSVLARPLLRGFARVASAFFAAAFVATAFLVPAFLVVAFLLEAFLLAAFLVEAFLDVAFLLAVFLVADLLASAFLVVGLLVFAALVTVFLIVDFFAVAFRALLLLAAVFLAADFLPPRFLPPVGAGFFFPLAPFGARFARLELEGFFFDADMACSMHWDGSGSLRRAATPYQFPARAGERRRDRPARTDQGRRMVTPDSLSVIPIRLIS